MAQLYGERWQVKESLGEGGQAFTYLVVDVKGDGNTTYVLKRLKNINRIERFRGETEAIRNLSHENVVRLIDFDLDVDKPFLVTEYCSGGNLAQAAPYWRESPEKAFELFLQVCDGLAHAHSKGVIHRDIKPDNILLRTSTGPAVVADFGICYAEDDGTRLTLTEEAMGPRLFIAPELEDGRANEVSTKSDVYSLGKLLYWLLSGGKVFSREKHRDQKWDLRGYNVDTLLGWNNVYMEHANRLLDLMVVSEPNQRRDLDNIRILARQAVRLIQGRFTPIGKDLPQPCSYCGQGRYVLRVQDSGGAGDFGFKAYNGHDWRILVCSTCGHVQVFRVEMANRKDWWS